jgi:lipopolysaccharide/colanic/teichoic acid biosynthesis glycosyltransferase
MHASQRCEEDALTLTLHRTRPAQAFDIGPQHGKRALDLVVASVALVVSAPLLIIAAVLVRLSSRGPILFRQERVGLCDERFTMLKFRTMRVNNDDSALRELNRQELSGERTTGENGSFKLARDPRITRVGRLLRATSIDELPQLFNVVRGDMSIVGPRPALPWETELFPRQYARRTASSPGITGLWQVSGRSRLSALDMLRLDVEYVDNWSLGLDVRITLRTIPALFRRNGAR